MITGVHAIIYNPDAEGVRAFFRDTLGFSSVDAGGGWLIFALPPAELGVHPIDEGGHHAADTFAGRPVRQYAYEKPARGAVLHFGLNRDMPRQHLARVTDKTVEELKRKGVEFTSDISDARFGRMTSFKIPGGAELALYQPAHPTAIGLQAS